MFSKGLTMVATATKPSVQCEHHHYYFTAAVTCANLRFHALAVTCAYGIGRDVHLWALSHYSLFVFVAKHVRCTFVEVFAFLFTCSILDLHAVRICGSCVTVRSIRDQHIALAHGTW